MRRGSFGLVCLVCLALAACSSSDGPCPGSFFCSAEQQGATCTQPGTAPPAACHCEGGVWTCTDCPDLELPRGTCSPGASCSVWGFENDCECACDSNGQWKCSLGDPSPNFHCSF